MIVDPYGIKMLMEYEGSKLTAYLDNAGYTTIGVGHKLTTKEKKSGYIFIGEERVYWGTGLNKVQVIKLLEQDIHIYENIVSASIEVPLTQNNFNALVSFVFNIGGHSFRKSTLRRLLNQGEYQEVPPQLKRWNKSNGKVNRGLVNRRKKEIKLWSRHDEY